MMKNKPTRKQVFHFILALLIFALFVFFIIWMYPGRDNFQIELLYQFRKIIFQGWLLTILISILSLVLSVVFGFSLYLLTKSKWLVFKYLGGIFDEVVFGSPMLVFLIVVYYFVSVPLGIDNRMIVGTLGLSLFMAPYMKNVFVGALASIDDLQYQAMKVYGFTNYQKYRFIIIPQVLKMIVPPLIGNLTFIIKGSSLLNFIGVSELYNQITTASSITYAVVEGYLLMFVLYLLITIPLIRLTKYLEKRVQKWT